MRLLALALAALLTAACGTSGTTGGFDRQPFRDIPVPEDWVPYTNGWVVRESAGAVTARLLYFTRTPAPATLEAGRAALGRGGWTERGSGQPFVSERGWAGTRIDFDKAGDTVRLIVVEGSGATHAELEVARRADRR